MKNITTNIREARPEDYPAVISLLQSFQLPVLDISPELNGFILSEVEGTLAGCICLEQYNQFGLLRSMAVNENLRNHGIASTLVNRVELMASVAGMESIFLVTTTATDYFLRKQYQIVNRSELPNAIMASREFLDLCPASSTVMVKRMKQI